VFDNGVCGNRGVFVYGVRGYNEDEEGVNKGVIIYKAIKN
jgi:hypothetical protein